MNGDFDLLLECCAAAIGTANRIESYFLLGVNWAPVAELAERHDVAPLVFRALHKHSSVIPNKALGDFRRTFERNAQKNLRLTFELTRILNCLSAAGVEAIPFKGPVLTEALYGDVALRQFCDLDVLIRPWDLERASEALKKLGYARSTSLSGPEAGAHVATGYEQAFDGPLGKNLLELQWRIVPRFYSIDLEVEDLFERSAQVTLGNQHIRVLSPEDLLLVLCIHAAKHAWVRLSWLCDVAKTVQTQTIDFEVVRSRAIELGIVRIVAVGLWLANRLLRIPMPTPLREDVENDARVARLGEIARRLIAQPSEFNAESVEYFQLMLQARERIWDRGRFLARLALTPGAGEWSAVRLPEVLFPLYRLVRIGRLCQRCLYGAPG